MKSAGSEFQRDGAMNLKERSPKNFKFCLGILSNFSFEDHKNEVVGRCRGMKKDTKIDEELLAVGAGGKATIILTYPRPKGKTTSNDIWAGKPSKSVKTSGHAYYTSFSPPPCKTIRFILSI